MDQDGDFGMLMRMVVVAVISGLVTATLVIAIGQPVLDRLVVGKPAAQVVLVRTSG